jgi:hypothetical protein
MRRFGLLLPLIFAACGGDDSGPPGGAGGSPGSDGAVHACVPGQSIACVAPGGCSGGQRCKSDGSGYEDCICTDAGTPPSPDGSATSDADASATQDARDSSTPLDAIDASMPESSTDATNDAGTCALAAGAPEGRFVAYDIRLPASNMQFAFDENGDGRLDNQYGAIIGALSAQGIDPQGAMNDTVSNGKMILLFDEMAADPTFANTTCAQVEVARAQNQASPAYDGGAFVRDSTAGSSKLAGSIVASRTSADIGRPSTIPPTVKLVFPLGAAAPGDGGATTLPEVPVTVVHVSFTNTSSGLTMGQLNGFISSTDVQTKLIPAIAVSLTAMVAADPGSMRSMQFLAIFDTGGDADPACPGTCKNPDASCATSGDNIISTCEVASNQIVKNIFTPDIQMFSNGGTVYAPNPANAQKDSVSIGFGFTAAKASF